MLQKSHLAVGADLVLGHVVIDFFMAWLRSST